VARVTALPRRLGAVPTPVQGEAFVSWLSRLAADLQIPPGQVAQVLGLPLTRGTSRPKALGIGLADRSREAFLASTGLDGALVERMLLTHYANGALTFTRFDLEALRAGDDRVVQSLAMREWALLHGSRACPACLSESPVWPLWWKLGMAACCPLHRLLLADDCSGCGTPLLREGLGMDPERCAGTARRPCGHPFTELLAIALPEDLPAVQSLVVRAAADDPPRIAGTAIGTAEWFAALRCLAAMIRFALFAPQGTSPIPQIAQAILADRNRQSRRTPGGPQGTRQMPLTAALAAGVLESVAGVLAAPDAIGCRRALEPILSALAARRRERHHNLLRPLPVPQALAAVLDTLTEGDQPFRYQSWSGS
jgi:hypothetical protein